MQLLVYFFKSPQLRLVAEGFTVLGALIYLVLEIKDVLITQGINAQLNTLVRLSNLFSNLPLILPVRDVSATLKPRENQYQVLPLVSARPVFLLFFSHSSVIGE